MLKRQNVPAELWGACTTINANHELSPYYSPDLVLPRPLVDEVKRLNVAPNLDQLMTAAGSLGILSLPFSSLPHSPSSPSRPAALG